MSGLVTILLLVAGGALWLALRPAIMRALPALDPKLTGIGGAAGLFLLAILFFALRLAPLGVVLLVLAGGALGGALRRPDPALEEKDPGGDSAPAPARAGMSRGEALAVLGLGEAPAPEEVEAAHRKMIRRAHPDSGGSDYLAAKVNEARDVLLG